MTPERANEIRSRCYRESRSEIVNILLDQVAHLRAELMIERELRAEEKKLLEGNEASSGAV